MSAMAVLPDGRVVSGFGDGTMLVLDSSAQGGGPLLVGRAGGGVCAMAVLPDGRVISVGGLEERRVLIWDPAASGADPVEFGRDDSGLTVVAVLPNGRVVTGGYALVLAWDPAAPWVQHIDLGYDDGAGMGRFLQLAVLPDGRLVSGGFDWGQGRVLNGTPTRLGLSLYILPPTIPVCGRWRCCRTAGWKRQ